MVHTEVVSGERQPPFSPAAQSLLPSVVTDEELVVANSGIWTAAVTAQIVVTPVAALFAVQVGFGPVDQVVGHYEPSAA